MEKRKRQQGMKQQNIKELGTTISMTQFRIVNLRAT
jgi:hypothetical protein